MIPAALRGYGAQNVQQFYTGQVPPYQRGPVRQTFGRGVGSWRGGGPQIAQRSGIQSRQQNPSPAPVGRFGNDSIITPSRKRPGAQPSSWAPRGVPTTKKSRVDSVPIIAGGKSMQTTPVESKPSLQLRGSIAKSQSNIRGAQSRDVKGPVFSSNFNKNASPAGPVIRRTALKPGSNRVAASPGRGVSPSQGTKAGVLSNPSPAASGSSDATLDAANSSFKTAKELREDLTKLHGQGASMKKEIQLYQNQVLELTGQLNKQKQRTSNTEKDLSAARKDSDKLKRVQSDLDGSRSKLKTKEDELRTKRSDVRNKESTISDLTRQKQSLNREVESLKSDLSKTRRDLSNERQRRDDAVRPLESQNRKMTLEITELRSQLRFQRDNADRFRPSQQAYNQAPGREFSDLNQKLGNAERERERLVTENKQLQEKMQKITGVLGTAERTASFSTGTGVGPEQSRDAEFRSRPDRDGSDSYGQSRRKDFVAGGQDRERPSRFGQRRDRDSNHPSSAGARQVAGSQWDSSPTFPSDGAGSAGNVTAGRFSGAGQQNQPSSNVQASQGGGPSNQTQSGAWDANPTESGASAAGGSQWDNASTAKNRTDAGTSGHQMYNNSQSVDNQWGTDAQNRNSATSSYGQQTYTQQSQQGGANRTFQQQQGRQYQPGQQQQNTTTRSNTATNAISASDKDAQPKTDDQQSTENGLYSVERIIGKDMVEGELMYRVKWLGFSEAESSWEPASNLGPATELIKHYEQSIASKSQQTGGATQSTGYQTSGGFQTGGQSGFQGGGQSGHPQQQGGIQSIPGSQIQQGVYSQQPFYPAQNGSQMR